ncbi:hypothetical protein [Haladaptatus sp. CMAA 1911]|uniref:hypothetical protein n=1 Tax=unclassified Haladaptatus TaxID=2622732 RepID=UPI003754B4C2
MGTTVETQPSLATVTGTKTSAVTNEETSDDVETTVPTSHRDSIVVVSRSSEGELSTTRTIPSRVTLLRLTAGNGA